MGPTVERFMNGSDSAVCGFVHRPQTSGGDALVLTHGAGSNCQAPLLVALAVAFAEAGFVVLRYDLPFRQERPHGPPSPRGSARDREGLLKAVRTFSAAEGSSKRIFLGGHSYGGRQTTLLAAADRNLADGLLLLSYPLHPPRKPSELRTAHFHELHTRALFVHGSHDSFGTLEEIKSALNLIPAATSLLPIDGAGHDLDFARRGRNIGATAPDTAGRSRGVVEAFRAFVGDAPASSHNPLAG
jgi:predicted alpha/beta-hydrolase family hydrolase